MALSGDRSPLFYWGGGAAKPLSTGTYAGARSLLAFWIGGACGWSFVPKPPYEPVIGPDGPSFLKHHEKGRPIDDEECVDFLRLWCAWNDVE